MKIVMRGIFFLFFGIPNLLLLTYRITTQTLRMIKTW